MVSQIHLRKIRMKKNTCQTKKRRRSPLQWMLELVKTREPLKSLLVSQIHWMKVRMKKNTCQTKKKRRRTTKLSRRRKSLLPKMRRMTW